jgi:type III pantothenate kinase
MLLAIDIGNTNIALGVFEERKLVQSWRVSTRKDQTADEYAVLCSNLFSLAGLSMTEVKAVVLCSVVPPLNECFSNLAQQYFGVAPFFVEATEQDLMPILYSPPSDVGADRIVDAIAAYRMYGGPSVVVDFGTATTFDTISSEGEYLGGIIAPGIGVSADALFRQAAKLPRIEIRKPKTAIGKSTVSSMQSGVFYGYVGLVEGVLGRIKEELGPASVTATGGYAELIATGLSGFDQIEVDLTMHGLRICFEHMRP